MMTGNVKVAQSMTELPNKKLLEKQLRKSLAIAREQFTEDGK
ncbi:MAG: hypothetical protein VB066_11945 [Paludibacter sp.]|nr:hypothetical protein [Paludibacter sp.]